MDAVKHTRATHHMAQCRLPPLWCSTEHREIMTTLGFLLGLKTCLWAHAEKYFPSSGLSLGMLIKIKSIHFGEIQTEGQCTGRHPPSRTRDSKG